LIVNLILLVTLLSVSAVEELFSVPRFKEFVVTKFLLHRMHS